MLARRGRPGRVLRAHRARRRAPARGLARRHGRRASGHAGGSAIAGAGEPGAGRGLRARRRGGAGGLRPVDVLINNAAVAFFGPTKDLPVSRWMASWRVTVHATFLLSKLVLPEMIERGWGRIVNVTSESAIGPGAGALLRRPRRRHRLRRAEGGDRALQPGARGGGLPDGVGVAAIAPSLIVPTPGALANAQITGADDPRAEDPAYMPEAIRHARDRPARADGRARRLQPAAAAGEGADRDAARGLGRGPGAPRDRLRQRPMSPAELAEALGGRAGGDRAAPGGAGRCEMWSATGAGGRSSSAATREGSERDVVREREWRRAGARPRGRGAGRGPGGADAGRDRGRAGGRARRGRRACSTTSAGRGARSVLVARVAEAAARLHAIEPPGFLPREPELEGDGAGADLARAAPRPRPPSSCSSATSTASASRTPRSSSACAGCAGQPARAGAARDRARRLPALQPGRRRGRRGRR